LDELLLTHEGDDLNGLAYMGTKPSKGKYLKNFNQKRDSKDSEYVKRFLEVRVSLNRQEFDLAVDNQEENFFESHRETVSLVDKGSTVSPKNF